MIIKRWTFSTFKRMSEKSNTIPKLESENMNQFWSEEQNHEFLLTRRKGQHLNKSQILYLAKQLEKSPWTKSYNEKFISYPDLQLKELQSGLVEAKRLKIDYLIIFNLQRQISDEAKQLVRSYLLPPWGPKTLPMVLKHV